MAHFIGLPTNATAKDVANVFLREVWKLHGLPTEIISDMDAKFSGELWESLCKLLGIKRKMSTAYHPQTDGQTERTNQVLEGYLRNFVNYDQDDWYQQLPLAEFSTTIPQRMQMECHPSSRITVIIHRQNGCESDKLKIQELSCTATG